MGSENTEIKSVDLGNGRLAHAFHAQGLRPKQGDAYLMARVKALGTEDLHEAFRRIKAAVNNEYLSGATTVTIALINDPDSVSYIHSGDSELLQIDQRPDGAMTAKRHTIEHTMYAEQVELGVPEHVLNPDLAHTITTGIQAGTDEDSTFFEQRAEIETVPLKYEPGTRKHIVVLTDGAVKRKVQYTRDPMISSGNPRLIQVRVSPELDGKTPGDGRLLPGTTPLATWIGERALEFGSDDNITVVDYEVDPRAFDGPVLLAVFDGMGQDQKEIADLAARALQEYIDEMGEPDRMSSTGEHGINGLSL